MDQGSVLIRSLVTHLVKERGSPYEHGLDPIERFYVVFFISYHSAGGEDQQILPSILEHI